MALTYNYSTGQITRDFVFKKIEGDCHKDPTKTTLIGVFCARRTVENTKTSSSAPIIRKTTRVVPRLARNCTLKPEKRLSATSMTKENAYGKVS